MPLSIDAAPTLVLARRAKQIRCFGCLRDHLLGSTAMPTAWVCVSVMSHGRMPLHRRKVTETDRACLKHKIRHVIW